MLPKDEMAAKLEEFIKERDHVSMVEIKRFLEEHDVPTSGDFWWEIEDQNIVLWAGMSQEFSDTMNALNERDNVVPEPASQLVYLIDGLMLKMPLALRPPKKGYKEPHWAPVCFRHREVVTSSRS